MQNTTQNFLATTTQKAAADLMEAFLALPEEKRNWSPVEGARTALNLVAECALINGYTAELIQDHRWPLDDSGSDLQQKMNELMAKGWDAMAALLKDNTERLAAALRAVPDEALETEITIQWGKLPLIGYMAYPNWNLAYHLGQINYITSMLGC